MIWLNRGSRRRAGKGLQNPGGLLTMAVVIDVAKRAFCRVSGDLLLEGVLLAASRLFYRYQFASILHTR